MLSSSPESNFEKLKLKAELKKNSLSESQKELIENPESLNKRQLLEYCELPDPDLRMFAFGLVLDRLLKEIPNPADLSIYHKKALKFIRLFPAYKNYIAEQYTFYLSNIIDICNTSEDLVTLIKNITQIESITRTNSIRQLYLSKFTCFVMSKCEELRCRMDIESLHKIALALEKVINFGLDLNNIGNHLFNICADYVIKKYNINGLNKNKPQGFSSEIQEINYIFGDLKRFIVKDANSLEKLNLIEKKIQYEIPVKQIQKPKKLTHDENLLITKDFSINDVVWRKNPIYFKDSEDHSVKVLLGKLPNQELIAKKTYKIYEPCYLENVKKEIQILSILSNIASSENCFIKYYGMEKKVVDASETKISLYMEGHEQNLMDKICEAKSKNEPIDKKIVEHAVFELIQAFTVMKTLRIYHRDINPHNILVTKNWGFKIIDFNVSDTYNNECDYTEMVGEFIIQGTHGYMAPEVEQLFSQKAKSGRFDLEKADVFSLGLTLYQMLSLKDIRGFNSYCNSSISMTSLENINNYCLKYILRKMLAFDYYRHSFNELICELPGEVTICL